MLREALTFRAMGTEVALHAEGVMPEALASAAALVHRCEQRWSRFRPDSELSRLNALAGAPVRLTPETYALVAGAVDAWYATAGRFDPTVLAAVNANGYRGTFEHLGAPVAEAPEPAPGCASIVLDDELRTVRLPRGVGLDLGGIAKGHTADLVVEQLVEAGASAALADIGGDIRAVGDWTVDVARADGGTVAVLRVADGGIATSSTRRRAWRTVDGDRRHHLVDPRTGRPSSTDVDQATALARTASTAEVLAKAVVVAGSAEAPTVVGAAGATGLLVTSGGVRQLLPGIEAFLA